MHPCAGVHRRRSLVSTSLLLQECPACFLRLTWIVCMMGGKWPYTCCLLQCCYQDLFKIARSILVKNTCILFYFHLHRGQCHLLFAPDYLTGILVRLVYLWRCEMISSKPILIFLKKFLDFRSNTIEEQGIINLSRYSSKSYASVILRFQG